jgi:hypothetical protein
MLIEPIKKCIIFGCNNHNDEVHFVGKLCFLCYTYLANGIGKASQAAKNERQIEEIKNSLYKG